MKSFYIIIETRMGWLGILGSEAGLRHIVLPRSSPQEVLSAFGEGLNSATPNISLFGDLPERLIAYFNGEVITFPDRLDLADATPFQRAVWSATCTIPYGETRSYTWVAQQIGIPKGSRAVGQALSKNPLPIVVPCHRVIGSGGKPGGFSYGLEMKRRLLQMEAARITHSVLDTESRSIFTSLNHSCKSRNLGRSLNNPPTPHLQ